MRTLALLLAAALAPAPALAAPPADAPPGTAAQAAPAPAAKPAASRPMNRVAALVNGEVVTLRELQARAGAEWQKAERMEPGAARDRAQARALKGAFDAIVAERLLEAQVKELQLEATDAEVDLTIEDIKRKNGLDDAGLARALAAEGLTREGFRTRLRKDLETMRVIQVKVRSKIKITDEDLKNHYQQHAKEFASGIELHVRHVFLPIPPPPGDEAAVRRKAEEVAAKARAGTDFSKLAREYSQGPSAADGGDLGWIKRGVIQPEVERAAYALEVGQVSDPVRTRPGFHVLKVEEKRGGEPRPFDQVKEEIRDKLTYEQGDVFKNQYVAELKKEAVIELRLPELQEP